MAETYNNRPSNFKIELQENTLDNWEFGLSMFIAEDEFGMFKQFTIGLLFFSICFIKYFE